MGFGHSTVGLRASVVAAASGDNTLVAAVAGQSIRVVAISLLSAGSAVSVYLHDTADTPNMLLGNGTHKLVLDKTGATGPAGFVMPLNEAGWFDTAAGKALAINNSAAYAVLAVVTYILVPDGQPY